MQGKIERLDARCESGQRHKEGGQTSGAERGRNHATPAAPAIDSAVRRH